MAATDQQIRAETTAGDEGGDWHDSTLGSVSLAALAIPGLWVAPAAATQPPGTAPELSVKLSHYRDAQPGFDRIRVTSPALAAHLPLSSEFVLELATTYDGVSGASPRWHSAVSGASRFTEHRTAGSGRLRYLGEHWTMAASAASSTERDYRSQAVAVEFTFDSDDRNRSWLVSLANTRDHIHPVNRVVRQDRRFTNEILAGVTQNWTANDVVQVLARHSRGRGYFNDPYKIVDRRPRERDQTSLVIRWNHHRPDSGLTWRSSYRYYRDSFGIRAHTTTLDLVLPLGQRLQMTPGVRYHSQSAANFYYDPIYSPTIGEPYPIDWPRRLLSSDHRLSAFGAGTVSLRLDWQMTDRWHMDARVDHYQQRSPWRLGGNGSPGLAPLRAHQIAVGMTFRF